MTTAWLAILVSWSTVIVGSTLAFAGSLRLEPTLALVGAIVLLPFTAYVAMHPAPARWLGIAAIGGLAACVAGVRSGSRPLALVALVPQVLLVGFVTHAVLAG